MLSLHTSPLVQPGSGDSGGMNVYVRELVSALAQAGVECTTYTRADRAGPARARCSSSPATGSCTSTAGPFDLPKEAAAEQRRRVRRRRARRTSTADRRRRRRARQLLAERRRRPPPQARPRPAARVDLPHARPGQGRGRRPRAGVARPRRGRGHRLRRRDLRQLHRGGAPVPAALRRPAGRIEIVAPGVEHAFFAPGDRARRAPGARPAGRSRRCCCSSGGSSRSRGPTSPSGRWPRWPADPTPLLVIVGGASGADGDGEAPRRPHARRRARRRPTGSASSPPQPHHILSHLLPRRRRRARAEPQRELRAGRARGGGVRHPGRGQRRRRAAHLVDDGVTGLPRRRVATRPTTPRAIGRAPRRPGAARRRWARRPPSGRARYTWSFAAARLRRLYADLAGASRRAGRGLRDERPSRR